MKNKLRRAAVAGLSMGLVLTSLAGCGKKDKVDWDAAAVTVNDSTVSAGLLNFAVRYEQTALESAYMSFGISDPFNQDLMGTGETLGETMKSQEAERFTHALLAEQHMEDYGVSVSDEEKADISAAAAAFMADNDEEVLEEIGATQEIVERYLELLVIQHKMEADDVMPGDIDTEVSDEEAAQRRVQYVLFEPVTEEETELSSEEEAETDITPAETELTPAETELTPAETEAETSEAAALVKETAVMTAAADETEMETEAGTDITPAETEAETETETEDPETAEAMAKALALAEEFLAKVQGGEDFDTAAEDMGETASETTFGADYYVEELVTATDGVADDTLVETPVKTDSGYYVVKVLAELDRDATDAEKEDILEQRRSDRISELYTEWEEAGEVSQDADVIAQIVFDYYLTPYVEPETEAETEITPAETEITPAETEAETVQEAEEETGLTPAETEAETDAEAETDVTPVELAETETE